MTETEYKKLLRRDGKGFLLMRQRGIVSRIVNGKIFITKPDEATRLRLIAEELEGREKE